MLAVLHVTQGIWLSRGTAYPGDLGDGRFNQLLLEHGYQSMRGVYAWATPGQFHPATGTLGNSDTHAGTLPIYATLRLLGSSIDRAWQQWFVVVAALNAFAALQLFTALGLSRPLRGPLIFAATASTTMTWFAGTHMQMLPIFPILFTWTALVRWAAERRAVHLLAAFGWFAWQFAAGPYTAFFGASFILAVGAIRAIGQNVGGARPAGGSGLRALAAAGVVAVVGLGLAVAVIRVYVQAVAAGAGRSMEEIHDLAPRLQSWFTASPVHFWYPKGWPGHMSNHVEQAWLTGFLPWALLLPALVVGWRRRATPRGAWLLAIAGGALAVALFFTSWNDGAAGLWIFAARKIEALRAFRATGRVAGLLQVAQVAAIGLLLTHWLEAATARRRASVVGLALLVVAEGLAAHQPVTVAAVAAKRADALIAAWRAAGDRPVLAYAFGYTNQPEVYSHLDAWSAALRLHRVTLNGYSGGMPGTHHRYLWNATPDNARALAAEVGLPLDKISIVEHFNAADDAALGIERFASRPLEHLDGFDVQPMAWRLYAFLERFVIDGVVMYQFTPEAEIRFRLPDSARRITYRVGFRLDAYTLGGRTDGGGVSWLLLGADGAERSLSYELLTPLTRPEHRGILLRSLTLPPGRERILILRTDTGPAHDLPWDYLLVGQLRVE